MKPKNERGDTQLTETRIFKQKKSCCEHWQLIILVSAGGERWGRRSVFPSSMDGFAFACTKITIKTNASLLPSFLLQICTRAFATTTRARARKKKSETGKHKWLKEKNSCLIDMFSSIRSRRCRRSRRIHRIRRCGSRRVGRRPFRLQRRRQN